MLSSVDTIVLVDEDVCVVNDGNKFVVLTSQEGVVAGGWWLVAGGWWLVAGGCKEKVLASPVWWVV